jgi:hypothetical protein
MKKGPSPLAEQGFVPSFDVSKKPVTGFEPATY